MSYKSVLRSMNAASNRYEREKQRQANQVRRAYERHTKKVMALEDKKSKILAELAKAYAGGKLTPEQYNELSEREQYIGLDLIAVGGAPFVTLAKRYISGKIDKDEFERLCKHILPSDFIAEKESINRGGEDKQRMAKEFIDSCKGKEGCQHCGKKGFFAFVKNYKGVNLCARHRKVLEAICMYQHNGYYFTVEPIDVVQEGEGKFFMPVNLNPHVLG